MTTINIVCPPSLRVNILSDFLKDIYGNDYEAVAQVYNMLNIPIKLQKKQVDNTVAMLSTTRASDKYNLAISKANLLTIYSYSHQKRLSVEDVANTIKEVMEINLGLTNPWVYKLHKLLSKMDRELLTPNKVLTLLVNNNFITTPTVNEALNCILEIREFMVDCSREVNINYKENIDKFCVSSGGLSSTTNTHEITIVTKDLNNLFAGIEDNITEIVLYTHGYDFYSQRFVDENPEIKTIFLNYKSGLNKSAEFDSMCRFISLTSENTYIATIDKTIFSPDEREYIEMSDIVLKQRSILNAYENGTISVDIMVENIEKISNSVVDATIFGKDTPLDLQPQGENEVTFNTVKAFLEYTKTNALPKITTKNLAMTDINWDKIDGIVETVTNSMYIQPIYNDINSLLNNTGELMSNIAIFNAMYISESLISPDIINSVYDFDTLQYIKELYNNTPNKKYISETARLNIKYIVQCLREMLLENN